MKAYRQSEDIPLAEAMLVWTRGEKVGVVEHPDTKGRSDEFQSSSGACYSDWRTLDDAGRKLRLMIDAWHISAFYEIPSTIVHEALLVIPEYRNLLADDCLPSAFKFERD